VFQAIQPGLVTSVHSAGIFIAEGDSTRTLNHFFGDHLATIRGGDEIPGVVKDGVQAAAFAKPGQAAVRNEFVDKASASLWRLIHGFSLVSAPSLQCLKLGVLYVPVKFLD
jgi:hypothetical protein